MVIVIVFFTFLALSPVVAIALRVYRPRAVVGPDRLSSSAVATRLVIGLVMGFAGMALVIAHYSNSKGLMAHPGHPARAITAADWAFLATVPPLASFATLLVVDWAIGGFELLGRLGISLRRMPIGVAKGLVAALVILPPTYGLSYVAEIFYHRFQVKHPPEHELLKVMREPQDPKIQWTLILAAIFVAPLCEEFLFRGHIQSLIRKALIAISSPWRRFPIGLPVGGFAIVPPAEPEAQHILSYAIPAIPVRLPVWQTWGAIVVTSMLFAAVHPLWMAPPIFFLALGLGYCYERTGNLWTSITVHCLFNSVSTFLYLNMQSP